MVKIKASKPISDLKKGDKIKIDSMTCEVDNAGILMQHKAGGGKSVAEMFIDIFNPKTDKDYQIRYFADNLEMSLQVFELQKDILYTKVDVNSVEW